MRALRFGSSLLAGLFWVSCGVADSNPGGSDAPVDAPPKPQDVSSETAADVAFDVPSGDGADRSVDVTNAETKGTDTGQFPDEGLADATTADLSDVATDALDCDPTPSGSLNVLFIGNSYTSANNLAGILKSLSDSLGKAVTATVRAPGGFTLGAQPNAHAESPETLNLIASAPWDVVVIQEQSQIPTIPSFYQFHTKTGGQKLADAVAANDPCTRVVLFMTWGRRDGGAQCIGVCSEDYADFDAMQDVLTARYVDLASTLDAELAPVGEAWRYVRATSPEIELFSGDGSHPSLAGSYLTAAVFFAALFGETPLGASEDAGVGATTAETLQQAAEMVVLTAPDSWRR